MQFLHKIIEKCFLSLQKAKLAGEDYYGNSYYILKSKDDFGRNIRYVKYFNKKESSAVPPLWSAWLRYYLDDIEQIKSTNQAFFVKNHAPNITGVKSAYFPTNHPFNPSRKKVEIYHSWIKN
jgi:NADH:ubiquinone oxidoreductase subunit